MSKRFSIGDTVECIDGGGVVTLGRLYVVTGEWDWSLGRGAEQAVEVAGVAGAVLASRFRLVDDGQPIALSGAADEATDRATPRVMDGGPAVLHALRSGTADECWLSPADRCAHHILSFGDLSLVAIDAAHDVEILEELVELLNIGLAVRRHQSRQAAKKIA